MYEEQIKYFSISGIQLPNLDAKYKKIPRNSIY